MNVEASFGPTCRACVDFREQRDQLIADVGLALGEVTKLRRLNDFYREKIRIMEEGGRPVTAGSLFRGKLARACDSAATHEQCDDGCECQGANTEAALISLQETIRGIRAENQMLRQQRDDFADQVREVNGKLDAAIGAAEDRAEAKLAGMRPGAARHDFEEEFKELKRLRILMRFSELKKDSDKLHETFKYVSKLETENSGLRLQLDRLLRKERVESSDWPKQVLPSPPERESPRRIRPDSSYKLQEISTQPKRDSARDIRIEHDDNLQSEYLESPTEEAAATNPCARPSTGSGREHSQRFFPTNPPRPLGSDTEAGAEKRPPSAQPGLLSHTKSLKQELTTAQALLELLNSRSGGGRLGVRPKTAGSTSKKYSHF